MTAKDSTGDNASSPESSLGGYLLMRRQLKRMSLREVQENSGGVVSNAYLSQLENGHTARPSPHILHALAEVYEVPYVTLMEKAGYLSASVVSTMPGTTQRIHRGRAAATRAVEDLTPEEEEELLKYLAFLRSKDGKRGKS